MMIGFLTFISIVLCICALAMLLGACIIGTFLAPLFWMQVVCFIVVNIFVCVITTICSAIGIMGGNKKDDNKK